MGQRPQRAVDRPGICVGGKQAINTFWSSVNGNIEEIGSQGVDGNSYSNVFGVSKQNELVLDEQLDKLNAAIANNSNDIQLLPIGSNLLIGLLLQYANIL